MVDVTTEVADRFVVLGHEHDFVRRGGRVLKFPAPLQADEVGAEEDLVFLGDEGVFLLRLGEGAEFGLEVGMGFEVF
jgi:hypothetical protein